jgi:hypothetical protein
LFGFFLVHNEDGSRAGCGLLSKIADSDLMEAAVTELSGSGVSGNVIAHHEGSGRVCFFATGSGLERNLASYLIGGTACNATNGCGLHFHNGTSCETTASQGGHWYADLVMDDPWKSVGYVATGATGDAYHANCLETGVIHFEGRPFIFHSNNGSRVACGIVGSSQPEEDTSGSTSSSTSMILYRHAMITASLSSLFLLSFWV